jgi:hypothetical protein
MLKNASTVNFLRARPLYDRSNVLLAARVGVWNATVRLRSYGTRDYLVMRLPSCRDGSNSMQDVSNLYTRFCHVGWPWLCPRCSANKLCRSEGLHVSKIFFDTIPAVRLRGCRCHSIECRCDKEAAGATAVPRNTLNSQGTLHEVSHVM